MASSYHSLNLEFKPFVSKMGTSPRRSVIPAHHQPGEYSCVEPVHKFVDLIQGKAAQNCSSAALGATVVETLDAAGRSAKSGKVEVI
jgi:hypothetical protein